MAKKPARKVITYTPSLGRVLANKAKRSRTGRFHVISSVTNGSKWSLVSEGSTKAIRLFSTKNAALKYVEKVDEGVRINHVIVHGKDGKIKDRLSFQVHE